MKKSLAIAIVDDDVDDREIVRDAFLAVKADLPYMFYESGEELMKYLHAAHNGSLPSLILLDLNMPGMDGRETLKELKANPLLLSIPTLVFTTSSSPKDKAYAYELGANCFISKPDTFQKLTDLAQCIIKLWQL